MYGYLLYFCAAVRQMYITCIRWERRLLSYSSLFERRLNVLWMFYIVTMFYTQLEPSWKWNFEVYDSAMLWIIHFRQPNVCDNFYCLPHDNLYCYIPGCSPKCGHFDWLLRGHMTSKNGFPLKLWPAATTKCMTSEGNSTRCPMTAAFRLHLSLLRCMKNHLFT